MSRFIIIIAVACGCASAPPGTNDKIAHVLRLVCNTAADRIENIPQTDASTDVDASADAGADALPRGI